MDAARRITQLGDWLAGTDVATLELTTPNLCIRLERDISPAASASEIGKQTADTSTRLSRPVVKAHSVGVFLDAHPLATAPLAAVSTRVAAGQIIGLLRIGALLLPVTAPVDAIVKSVLATPGEAVGHGMALFTLQPL